MNKQFWISVVALLVLTMVFGGVIHGVLLKADYSQIPNVMRPEAESQQKMPLMMLAHLLIALAITWIYRQGRTSAPWLGQGVRFGVALALLTCIPWFLIYHVVTQVPMSLAIKQILFETIGSIVYGVAAAFLNRS